MANNHTERLIIDIENNAQVTQLTELKPVDGQNNNTRSSNSSNSNDINDKNGKLSYIDRFVRFIQFNNYTLRNLMGSPNIDARILFAVRLIIFVWFITLLFVISISDGSHDWPAYLTNQSYGIIVLYFGSQVIISILSRNLLLNQYSQVKTKNTNVNPNTVFDIKLPHYAYMIPIVLWDLLCVGCFIVTVVYWILLWPSSTDKTLRYFNFQVHALNLIIFYIEFSLNHANIIWSHLVFVYAFAVYYLIFAIIYHNAGGKWLYGFLDYSKPSNIGFYFGVLIAVALVYAAHLGLNRLKLKWFSTKDEKQYEINYTNQDNSDNNHNNTHTNGNNNNHIIVTPKNATSSVDTGNAQVNFHM